GSGRFAELLGDAVGVAHGGERREHDHAEKPQRHQREPERVGQIPKPSRAEGDEERHRRHADGERPFARQRGKPGPALFLSLVQSRLTPAAVICAQARWSEPSRSIARQAFSMTVVSNPAARASSAVQATQKSVARPQTYSFSSLRSRR